MYICESGLEAHARLGNFVVPMLVDCGNLVLGQQAFHRLYNHNECSCTSLMQGYLDFGEGQHAFHLFQKMQESLIPCSKFTLQVLLKVCTKLKVFTGIHDTHIYFIEESYDNDSFVGNALVHAYANSGFLRDAKYVFDRLFIQDVISWTSLLAGYSDHGLTMECLHCWEQMQLQGVTPNAFTAASTLAACGNIEDFRGAYEIHSFVVKVGFESESFVGNILVDLYGKFGHLVEAHKIFCMLPVKDEVASTSLVTGYVRNGHAKEARIYLKQMKEAGMHINLVFWNALMAEYADLGLSDQVFEIMKIIEEEGLHPDIVTLTIYVKVCGKVRSLDDGRSAHIEATKLGYDSDDLLGTSLIDMYSKCGFLSEACKIFKNTNAQGIVAWTALVSGYAEHESFAAAERCMEEMRGRGFPVTTMTWNALIATYYEMRSFEEAVDCFKKMRLEKVAPNTTTYINLLKCWTLMGSICDGQHIHMQISKEGLEDDPFLCACIIDFYAKCGTLEEVKSLFSTMACLDVVLWSTLIAAFADYDLFFECLNNLEKMQTTGVSPNTAVFTHCLRANYSVGDLSLGQILYLQILEWGFERDESICSLLICMFLKHSQMEDAVYVFDSLKFKDLCAWNILISGYAEHGYRTKVMECLGNMQQCAVFPSALTYACSLKGADLMIGFATCQQIHADTVIDGFVKDLSVGNALIDWYSRFGFLEEAKDILFEMNLRNEDSWTTIISGYSQWMHGDEALRCFQLMRKEGLCPKYETFVWSLKACTTIRDLDQGYDLHSEILKRGLERFSFLGNSVLETYIGFGYFLDAQRVFDSLPFQNVVSWNTLITGHVENGLYEEALIFINQMQAECLYMDDVTLVGGLKSCANLGALGHGQDLHIEVAKRGLENITAVMSSLVDMYAKGGLLHEALQVFRKSLAFRDVQLWTAIISAYTYQGDFEGVLSLITKIKDVEMLFDEIGFLAMLTACSHAGLITEGQSYCNYFKQHGVSFNLEHFNCLIDLFSRAGQLLKASALIESMPGQPNLTSWITLLGACRKWHAKELGELTFCYAGELVGSQTAPYILLASCLAYSF
ncbi:hypothetical protein KP509_01G051500 [Ceratopteris richardii]|nr:hypothetical protein KP509_01G051500 [Ceratopteris richardii]